MKKEQHFPNSTQFDYQQFPFYWIAQLEARYKQAMEKTLKNTGLDASLWRVGLLLREHNTLTISEIASKALGKIPTITKTVQRMEKDGLVKVFRQPDDGRVRLVSLTERGQTQVDAIVENTAPLFEHVFTDFTPEEINTYITLSKRLFDNLAE